LYLLQFFAESLFDVTNDDTVAVIFSWASTGKDLLSMASTCHQSRKIYQTNSDRLWEKVELAVCHNGIGGG